MKGETLAGRYSIENLLGEGAMGSVYEARHLGTRRRVAVKVISDEMLKHEHVLERFKLEAQAAGAIDSQHIAQVLDVGHDEERKVPFLVMEFLKGEDLTHLSDRLGKLPPDLVARIAAQTCIGLSRAHAAGIVHRDIKPGNLYLAERDEGDRIVKILDFGIAKVKSDAEQGPGVALTRTGNLVGTPLYMSPEQARGDKIIDARADIWSLGVVMYQMLTGNTPHHDVDSLGKLIIQICSAPAAPLEEIAPWVPRDLAAIVMRCLEIDPPERFQTADELLAALRATLPGGSAIQPAQLVALGAEASGERAATGDRAAAASASSVRPPAGVTGTAVMGPLDVPRPQVKSPSVMPPSMPPPPSHLSYPPPPNVGSLLPPPMSAAAMSAMPQPPPSAVGVAPPPGNRALVITIAAGVVALVVFTAYRVAMQSRPDPTPAASSAPPSGGGRRP